MDAGFEVVEAADNAAVRAELHNGAAFDLIVLNGVLPDGEGVELCAELRRSGVSLPILLQGGHGSNDYYRAAMLAGVSDLLPKPWLPSVLRERIQFLLDMPPIARPTIRNLGHGAGTNLPTVRQFADEKIASALKHLTAVRPIEGSLPLHLPNEDEEDRSDNRPIALDEKTADELLVTLKAIQRHLETNPDDLEERAKLRASLVSPLSSIGGWLGGRATVVTDEIIKKYMPLALAIYVAHLSGLKFDLLHTLIALGYTPLPGH